MAFINSREIFFQHFFLAAATELRIKNTHPRTSGEKSEPLAIINLSEQRR
jgi:hypothetical protein